MYQFCIRLPQYRGKKTCIRRGGQSPISEKENQMNESRIECQVLHTVIRTIKVGPGSFGLRIPYVLPNGYF